MRDLLEELLALLPDEEEAEVAVLEGLSLPGRSRVGGDSFAAERATDRQAETWTERAGRKPAEAVTGLYAKVNGGRLRLERPERETVTVYEVEQAAPARQSAARDVRELDRVFRRDARRYDGGLGLL